MSILRVKGVAIADATQLITAAGFIPMFFFLTLYMQTVLHYSPIQTGLAYLPLTAGFIVASGISSQLFGRIGTKPVIVVGTVVAAAGLYWLSRIPVEGSYVSDLLPGLLVAAIGLGGVFVGATTAANAGVSEDKAGLAAGLLNTGTQLGGAVGLAILSALGAGGRRAASVAGLSGARASAGADEAGFGAGGLRPGSPPGAGVWVARRSAGAAARSPSATAEGARAVASAERIATGARPRP